jgi:acyl-CoA synthetase (AMP-forming)/AMP-acid ligase II
MHDAQPDIVLVGIIGDWNAVSVDVPASVALCSDANWRVCWGTAEELAVRPPPPIDAGDSRWAWPGKALPYAVFYTSGTTGQPKGVVLSHSAVLSQARAKLAHVGYDDRTRYLHLAPLFHLGGASSAIAVALAGGVHVIARDEVGKNTGSNAMAAIVRNNINTLVAVPAVLQMMVDDAAARSKKHNDRRRAGDQSNSVLASSVETILYGGGTLSSGLRRALESGRFFGRVRLIGAYGMTEAASSMTFLDHSKLPSNSRKHNSVGRTPWHVELKVRRVESSFRVRGGWETGEVMTRGPHVMDGYLGRPIETAAALTADDWLATGDLGYVDDDGDLHIVGRLKDMIKSGGECVFAGEVEAVLDRHPLVAWASVVGVPHRVLGEAVAAAVVLVDGEGALDAIALDEWCRRRLSPYKRPRWFVSLDKYPPVGGTGKIRKDDVRSEVERALSTMSSRDLRARAKM